MSTYDYRYTRKDGETTDCYGMVEPDSNFDLVCVDEYDDGIAADIDGEEFNTWFKVCLYLEENYHGLVVEVTAC